MKQVLLTLVFLSSLCLYGQNRSSDFGNISYEELEMVSYDKDPDAEAVVLFNTGISYFTFEDDEFKIVFQRNCRIKILSEAGISQANISIPFYVEKRKYEDVKNIIASTYNLVDGKVEITGLRKNNIYTEDLSPSWKSKKFAIPDVKVGSVIEYSYEIVSPFNFNLQDWDFQSNIPTAYSKYVVKMIPFFEYQYILVGASRFDASNSYEDNKRRRFKTVDYNEMVHEFAMFDVPAFRDTEYIRSINNNLIKLDFQLAKIIQLDGSIKKIVNNWESLIKDFLKDPHQGKFYKKIKRECKGLLNENVFGLLGPELRMEKIVRHVKVNYKWDGFYSRRARRSPSDFLALKSGNSAEINMFLAGLLAANGIETKLVLASTRNHGKLRLDYPFSHFFNNIIVLATINGKEVLLDGTDQFCEDNTIPLQCMNDKGLVIDKESVQWKSLEIKPKSDVNTQIEIAFNSDAKEFNGKVSVSARDYGGYKYRKMFYDDKSEIAEFFEEKGFKIDKDSILTSGYNDVSGPYDINIDFSNEAEIIGNKIYISPLLNMTISKNPLTQKIRVLPVDFGYIDKNNYKSSIRIPDGYKISYKPENFTFSNALIVINYTINVIEDEVIVEFTYELKDEKYKANSYQRLKYYFNEIMKYGSDKIIFEKE